MDMRGSLGDHWGEGKQRLLKSFYVSNKQWNLNLEQILVVNEYSLQWVETQNQKVMT